MKKSEIKFEVDLDENSFPKTIKWDASDKEGTGLEDTKSISLNVWDNQYPKKREILFSYLYQED